MPVDAEITSSMRKALEIVRADPSIQIIDELTLCPTGEAEFRCSVPVHPFPNPEGLPERVRLRVRLDSAFPYHDIDVFPEDDSVRGFAHQDAETHKLCLFPERMAPWDARRLKVYIDWACEWLGDAATDKLLRPGEPYELPDFSRRNFRDKLPTALPLLFDETANSFGNWATRIGTAGYVELQPATSLRGLLTRRFFDEDGQLIRSWTYPESLANAKDRISGRWMLLRDPRYARHRPAQTFGELAHACHASGIDLLTNIRLAREEPNKEPEVAFCLVGFPIPAIVGEAPSEVHWQPLYFRNNRTDRRERRKQRNHERSRFTASGLWNSLLNENGLASDVALPWGRSDNISRQRLYRRGAHRGIATHRRIALAGCGALGGIVAEMIVRGGAHEVCLLDKDLFEMGNQCRHTLDGRSLHKGKATAIAERLQSGNPLSIISGYVVSLPPNYEQEDREKILAAINDAALIIDCTTDEGSFRWLDKVSRRTGARMVSLFLNFRATILTLTVSGRSTPCSRVCQRLYGDIYNGITPVTAQEFGGPPDPDELVLPGAGCWHPTFPATNADVWMMAAAGVNALNQVLSEPLKTDGTALLLRRNVNALVSPLEVVWMRKYR